jgi:7tm Chemosensory receptor
MSKALESWMKCFYVTGTSVKVFFDKRSPLWLLTTASILLVASSIIASLVLCDYDNFNATRRFIITLIICATCFGGFLIILVTIAKAKVERNFWKTVAELEDIFETNLGEDFLCGNFNKAFGLKVILLSLFLLYEIPALCLVKKNTKIVLVRYVLSNFVLKIYLKMFLIKYTFFVDVLRLCLRNIELKLKKKQFLRLSDLKILKKAYGLCFELNVMIEEIFGLGVAYLIALLFAGSVFYGHLICHKKKMDFRPTLPLLINILEIFVTVTTCQKCADTSKSITSLALRINSQKLHKIVADFAIQTMNHKIKFEPKTFFVISHKLVVIVSIDYDSQF